MCEIIYGYCDYMRGTFLHTKLLHQMKHTSACRKKRSDVHRRLLGNHTERAKLSISFAIHVYCG